MVRHGETAFNTGKIRFRGNTDANLSNYGIQQAIAVGKAFANIKLDNIYYSKMIRAQRCAEEIKEELMKWAWPQIKRGLGHGFSEYYKTGR